MTAVNKLYNFYTHSYNYHNKGGCSLRQCSFNESPEINPKSKIKQHNMKMQTCFSLTKSTAKKCIYICIFYNC